MKDRILKILTKDDFLRVIIRKIRVDRSQARESLRAKHFGARRVEDFHPVRLEKGVIDISTLVSREVYYQMDSRRDVKKLRQKQKEEFIFQEGKTSIKDLLRYYFQRRHM